MGANVLFVCKLNPVTQDEDLEIIFSRFGEIKSCDIIRDHKSGDSLQYAFIEFEKIEECEKAYLKMDNVLIDERRIHVDFSQSVAKQWLRWKKDGKWANKQDTTTQYMSDLEKSDDPRWEEKKQTYMNKWASSQRQQTKQEYNGRERRNSGSSDRERRNSGSSDNSSGRGDRFKKPKMEYNNSERKHRIPDDDRRHRNDYDRRRRDRDERDRYRNY